MPPMLLPGFMKADTNNLPFVDIFMVYEFFNSSSLLQPEASHDKTQRSTEPQYGDKAIGYVQVKRVEETVTVRGLMRPQTRIRNEDYIVTATVRDRDTTEPKKILKVTCNKCAASNAMCKHIVAFVAWLNRRSDEDSPTSVECYWRRSALADIGAGIPFITAQDLGTQDRKNASKPGEIEVNRELLKHVIDKCKELNLKQCMLYNQSSPQIHCLSMHSLLYYFYESSKNTSFNKFIRYLKQKLDEQDLKNVEFETKNQSDSSLWRELRYGRITASKVHEISKCQTEDGTLVKMVLGAKKIKDNKYMKRGRELENPVLNVVQKKLKLKINKTGLVLNSAYPLFGSSPDGITDKYVFEVKCPANEVTFQNYIDSNSKPKPKYDMQIQLQMLMSNRKEGYFCVAYPNFEVSKNVKIINVHRDDNNLLICMHNAMRFWEKHVFTKLSDSVKV